MQQLVESMRKTARSKLLFKALICIRSCQDPNPVVEGNSVKVKKTKDKVDQREEAKKVSGSKSEGPRSAKEVAFRDLGFWGLRFKWCSHAVRYRH